LTARRRADVWTWLATGGLLVLATVVLFTFRDYGLSWDEEHSADNGRLALAWMLSAGRDQRIIEAFRQQDYGSFFNLLARVASGVSPVGLYETGHLLIAIFAWLGILFVFRLGRAVGGSRCGFFAALCLTLTPAYYGHAFVNPKDVPLAALFAAAAYYAMRAFDELPRPARGTLVGLAVAMGCAMGVRVIAAFLLLWWGLVIAVWWLLGRSGERIGWRAMLGWWWKPVLAAWGIMVAFWPYAQLNPIVNPFRAFVENTRFEFHGNITFNGRYIMSDHVPWTYLPVWFGVTLPEFYGIGLVAGVIAALVFLVRARGTERRRGVARVGLLAVAVLVPIAGAIVRHAVLYDGMRHFLFTLPFCAVLAGWGLASACGAVVRGWPHLRVVPAAALVLLGLVSMGVTVADMIALHPYEYIYFNRLVGGGEKAAAKRFDTDYWGLSYKEGLAWLKEHYPVGARPVRVANCSSEFLTSYWIREDPALAARFVPVDVSSDPDILLATTRYNCHTRPGTPLYVVGRKGVPLMYVLERKRPAQ
jgi:Dolichyl-phosphate-mannose-protein mannosyltransferase